MICTHCTNSRFNQTGKYGCMLPHCNKSTPELESQLTETWECSNEDRLTITMMIRRELGWREEHE
jgi:hypothetical protein